MLGSGIAGAQRERVVYLLYWCFTGTDVQIIAKWQVLRERESSLLALLVLYWYKRTNNAWWEGQVGTLAGVTLPDRAHLRLSEGSLKRALREPLAAR